VIVIGCVCLTQLVLC